MTDTKYILGTEDDELTRLERQHEVWKKETQELYRVAEFSEGQTVLDLGCGSGFTTLDLQKRVGKTGQVIAIDASEKFTRFMELGRNLPNCLHLKPCRQLFYPKRIRHFSQRMEKKKQ